MSRRRLFTELFMNLCESVSLGFAGGYILSEGAPALLRWPVWLFMVMALGFYCGKVRARVRWEQQDRFGRESHGRR